MDPTALEALVHRLVQNPYDEAVISEAHLEGQKDPEAYAKFLERVGSATSDPALACYWLTEAASVWMVSLSDLHRAARTLMLAIDRDPSQAIPAQRLADLYRNNGDMKALAALLERRAKVLGPLADTDPEIREQLVVIHEELGRVWAEPPLSRPTKAIKHYRRAIDFDPSNQFAIYSARELLKAQGSLLEALPFYEMEHALCSEVERRVTLYADEADVRQSIGDSSGATEALRQAVLLEPSDPTMRQQLATIILERSRMAQAEADELHEASALFVGLAEEFDGEYGFSYALCALELVPGYDRAFELALHYGEGLGRSEEVIPYATAYLDNNPTGAFADHAAELSGSLPPRPVPSVPIARISQRAPHSSHAPAARSQAPVGRSQAPVSHSTAFPQPRGAFTPHSHVPSEEQAPLSQLEALLSEAGELSSANRKNEAYKRYREALELDPAQADALIFVRAYLKRTRKFSELREVLLQACEGAGSSPEASAWLREVAGICESHLRDFDGAIAAWERIREIEPSQSEARAEIKRLLESAARWDDLAVVLEEEAEQTSDTEVRIVLEKNLSKLHESKRKDFVAAGKAWARIAALSPGDESAILQAVAFFEQAANSALAAQVIAAGVSEIADLTTRVELYKKLALLREDEGDLQGAGEALCQGATETQNAELWDLAEDCFVRAGAWSHAASALHERAQVEPDPKRQAALFAREAGYLLTIGDQDGAAVLLERASDLSPEDEKLAAQFEGLLTSAGRRLELALFFLRRAERIKEGPVRVDLRKRAARIHQELGDADACRESLELVLLDGDDYEALALLVADAENRDDSGSAVDYLKRLGDVTPDLKNKVSIVLRQARLLAQNLNEIDGAIDCYRLVLNELDPSNLPALLSVADLELQRGEPARAAADLANVLALYTEASQKLRIAGRLADLYEKEIGDDEKAFDVLKLVHAFDEDDLDALQRLCSLAEKLQNWPSYVDYLAELIAVEGDEEELSTMTLRLAEVLSQKLDRQEDAFEQLGRAGDQGDIPCRNAYVTMGDALGKKAEVATRLVSWFRDAPASPARTRALNDAFDRYVEAGDDLQASAVAKDLARARAADPVISVQLEAIAVRLGDLDALELAHNLIVRDLSGLERAEEMVRQAEVLARSGVEATEAVQHGEQALAGITREAIEPLLSRLAKLAIDPRQIVDIYERQITRHKQPSDRLLAFARAAQVATEQELYERARGFFDLALGGTVQKETLTVLEQVAQETDAARGGKRVRGLLAEAMAAGGQGARDGGRTRSGLLRRAALMAINELDDTARAFEWIGDSLVTYIDDENLAALSEMGKTLGGPKRAEAVLTRALEEVFDGPLVRKLLTVRGRLRRDSLGERSAAAEDIKRLHELSPGDSEIAAELSALYADIDDYRGLVQLYEDQILRSRDQAERVELARQIAILWRDKLDDPKETADAWRRVLRMKPADIEATDGLAIAKQEMLTHHSQMPSAPDSTIEMLLATKAAAAAKRSESDLQETNNTTDEAEVAISSDVVPNADLSPIEEDAVRAADYAISDDVVSDDFAPDEAGYPISEAMPQSDMALSAPPSVITGELLDSALSLGSTNEVTEADADDDATVHQQSPLGALDAEQEQSSPGEAQDQVESSLAHDAESDLIVSEAEEPTSSLQKISDPDSEDLTPLSVDVEPEPLAPTESTHYEGDQARRSSQEDDGIEAELDDLLPGEPTASEAIEGKGTETDLPPPSSVSTSPESGRRRATPPPLPGQAIMSEPPRKATPPPVPGRGVRSLTPPAIPDGRRSMTPPSVPAQRSFTPPPIPGRSLTPPPLRRSMTPVPGSGPRNLTPVPSSHPPSSDRKMAFPPPRARDVVEAPPPANADMDEDDLVVEEDA